MAGRNGIAGMSDAETSRRYRLASRKSLALIGFAQMVGPKYVAGPNVVVVMGSAEMLGPKQNGWVKRCCCDGRNGRADIAWLAEMVLP